MSYTWNDVPPPPPARVTPLGWVRAFGRGGAMLALLGLAFPLLLLVRLPERLVWGEVRPLTPWITQAVCIATCRIIGLSRQVGGAPMAGMGAYVSNHASWLDIFVLNASKRLYFVSKAEVAGWPGIGWLARGTGTVFVRRAAGQAAGQARLLADRLRLGHRLLFFPEGTSTDGQRVLAFRTSLFAAFFADGLREDLQVQPVTITYRAPEGEVASFYGWWGDMGFGQSLLKILAARGRGAVRVTYHAPLAVADFADRKSLARAAEIAVRSGL